MNETGSTSDTNTLLKKKLLATFQQHGNKNIKDFKLSQLECLYCFFSFKFYPVYIIMFLLKPNNIQHIKNTKGYIISVHATELSKW